MMHAEMARPRVSGEVERKTRGELLVFSVARDRLEEGRGGGGKGGEGP